ncbi:signal peptidase I [Aquibacillus saliphilus]|uniref:signal peptidase I n=1 Tax=Aquibacillus saliphilus TaxID=1909422 RepID=UPI001CF0A9FB|nr:signal peptidase I [Aquibacillus saliphilus]
MKSKMKEEVFSWIKAIVVALVIVLISRHFFIAPSIVKGESMMPSLHDGDRIIISKMTKIDRFDEIAFQAPDSDDNYVKRVIGLPGDEVVMKDDTLYINGKVYDEPYLDKHSNQLAHNEQLTENFNLEKLTGVEVVPEGSLFVLGDNRIHSKDSRYFGFISEESVIGDVKIKIWPLSDFGIPN